MAADDAPFAIFACPHPRVSMRSANECSRNFDGETRFERSNGNIGPDATHAKLLGFMFSKSNQSRSMCLEILSLCSEFAVWASEQQLIRDQRVERGDIGVELSGPYTRLELDDFIIRRTDKYRGH
jgi:hypothetical protein